VIYQKHFAFTRLPLETPAETDELFESNARREAEARLGDLIHLRGTLDAWHAEENLLRAHR